MTLDGEPEESDGFDLESVDRFLDFQRRLLDDAFEADDDLAISGGAAFEDEPDELDP
jgi:hypothetical protein